MLHRVNHGDVPCDLRFSHSSVDPLEQGGRSPGSARCPRRLPESIDAAIGAALTDLQSGSKRSVLVQARLLPAEIAGAGRRGIANRKERPRQRLSPSAFEPPPQVLDAVLLLHLQVAQVGGSEIVYSAVHAVMVSV